MIRCWNGHKRPIRALFSISSHVSRLKQGQTQMDAFQKHYPHLRWSWPRRKWFLFRYRFGMAVSYIRTICWQLHTPPRS